MRNALWLLLVATLATAGCVDGDAALHRAARQLREGQATRARDRYVELTRASDRRVRLRACLGAARASLALHDTTEQRRWLATAVQDPPVNGLSEEAYLEYADVLRADGNRSEALNYYYRAAAGAERHLNRGYIYERAIHAIAALGMTP